MTSHWWQHCTIGLPFQFSGLGSRVTWFTNQATAKCVHCSQMTSLLPTKSFYWKSNPAFLIFWYWKCFLLQANSTADPDSWLVMWMYDWTKVSTRGVPEQTLTSWPFHGTNDNNPSSLDKPAPKYLPEILHVHGYYYSITLTMNIHNYVCTYIIK